MTLAQALDQTAVVLPLQADTIVADPDIVVYQSDHIAATDAWGMPADLPLPVSTDSGVLLPATARPSTIGDYDPWLAINLATNDRSRPRVGPYGEPSVSRSGSIVAEWGGMPSPARDWQDQTHACAQLRRNVLQMSGPTGRYYGAQQTAWEASAGASPAPDYWSTIILGAGG